jgi:hypothetical protein
VDDNNFAYVAKLKWSNDDRISVGGGMDDDVDEGMGRMAAIGNIKNKPQAKR